MDSPQQLRRRQWSSINDSQQSIVQSVQSMGTAPEHQVTPHVTPQVTPPVSTPAIPQSAPQEPLKKNGGIAKGFTAIFESLSPRQIGTITVGSSIGTGLMIGTARALSMSGPAAMMISFSFVGLTIYLVLLALGEVAAWLPKPTTLADHANRYCDPALGFSLAWIYWLKYAIVTPNQLTAATLLIRFWVDSDKINPGVWITVFIAVITAINFAHQGLPGRLEFYISSFKLLVMSALMILSLVIAFGGGPDHDRRGFRYWQSPHDAFGAFNASARANEKPVDKFFVVCNTMSSAAFAFVGSERSGILIRAPNVRKAISRAIKHTFYRVLVSHLLAIILLGMIIPSYSEHLIFHGHAEKPAAASPFVAAIYLSGIKVVPHILNACILLFVLSIGNFDLFLATKAMCDLALKHRAPAILARTNSRGVPVYSLLVCTLISTLAYINVSKNSTVVFGYFVNLVTMLGLLTWVSVLITHISFVRARKAQGVLDTSLVFRARFGLFGTALALVLCIFITATMTLASFHYEDGELRFDPLAIVSSYVAVPVYLLLIFGYKFAVRSKGIEPMEADLWTDKLDINVPLPEIVVN